MAEAKKTDGIQVPGYLKFSKIIVWLLYFWVMFGVIMLVLRVFLLAFSANMSAGFSRFVARTSDDYLEPFRGIFTGREVGETGYFDVSAVFAIIVYLFIAWGFHSLIDYLQGKVDESKRQQKEEMLKEERKADREALAKNRKSTTRSRTAKG